MKPALFILLILLVMLAGTACDSNQAAAPTTQPADTAEMAVPDAPAQDQSSTNEQDGPIYGYGEHNQLARVFEPWYGDLPQLVERRVIRALVPWSDTYFYLDGAQQRGIAFEAMTYFEKWLNEKLGSDTVEIHVVILPVRRDMMIPFIAEGRGDLALGGISITDDRKEIVDFSAPASKEIQEWLVESTSAERVANLEDLAGRTVYVRESSSYWESLADLNAQFAEKGLEPIDVQPSDRYLSTEDQLHLVNADAISYTVADNEIAKYWSGVLPDIRIREDIVIREGVRYGWAMRKDSPELKKVVDEFLVDHRQGTLLGNIVINRYFKDTERLSRINGDIEQQRLNELIEYFQTYAPEYEFDALMMVAQGFQESRLDQSKKSHRGAMGVMQLLPSTAADPAVDVPDISTAQNNILAGIRYMAWIRDTYFNDPELDELNKTCLAFASYNAGPNRIRSLRQKAASRGLDPNVWFDNVELIAAEDIGRETVDYVANIRKYYIAFDLSRQHQAP